MITKESSVAFVADKKYLVAIAKKGIHNSSIDVSIIGQRRLKIRSLFDYSRHQQTIHNDETRRSICGHAMPRSGNAVAERKRKIVKRQRADTVLERRDCQSTLQKNLLMRDRVW